MVSFTQDAAFATTEPFAFGTIGSLMLTTEAVQVVHDWMILENIDLTVTSSDRVRVAVAIGASEPNRNLGTGSLTLVSTGRGLRILVDISTMGDITLSGGTGEISFDNRAAKTLSGAIVTLTGTARSNRDLAINATSGALTLNSNINTGTNALSLSGSGGITLGSALTLTGGAIELTGDAAGAANLTINASGTLTLNSNINIGTNALTLTSGAGAIVGVGTPELTASTVSLRQADVFGSASPFNFSTTGSLVLITEAAQDVHDWMIEPDRNLTVTSASNVIVRSAIGTGGVAGRDLGDGSITLESTGGAVRILADISADGNITLSGGTNGINLNSGAGAKTLSGAIVTLTGNARSNRDLTLTAREGVLTFNGDSFDTGTNNLTFRAATIRLGRASRRVDPVGTVTLTGRDIRFMGVADAVITNGVTTGGITVGRFNLGGAFRPTTAPNLEVEARSTLDEDGMVISGTGTVEIEGDMTSVANITLGSTDGITVTSARTITGRAITLTGDVTASDGLTVVSTGILTFIGDRIATGTGNLSLTGATINLGRTTPGGAVGTVNLTGSAITLTAAGGITVGRFNINGDFLPARAPALAVDASGVLTINAAITSVAGLTLQGAGAIVATGRPRLTASTVSLAQIDAFAADANGRGLFRFTAGSLVITTEAAQDVHNWMIADGRNLTLTSPARVNMAIAIGAGVPGRNIGAGTLTLTSMEADIRIEADITTTGNITLNGSTGINLSGDARTISGAAIMLTGVAASDANVTITASGTLTLNNDIDIGTNALTLTSGAGAIGNGGTATVLTASTVSLRQVDVFGDMPQFTFGVNTGSLELTTNVNQEVYNWMILENTDLTVTSARNVIVRSAIGDGLTGRDLGTGALTLTSTGGVVRIFADISTTGNLTLNGNTGINLSGGAAKTLSGAAITLTGDARSDRDLAITASGTLRINSNITLTGTGALTLSSGTVVRILAGDISSGGNITLSGGTNGINFNNGAGAKTLSGVDIEITGNARSNRALTLTASGTLTLNGGINTGTSALSLSGSSVALGGALTLTGGDITLTGVATGTASLTITASGTLTLNNDIDIGTGNLTLTSGVGAIVATGRPRLTADMVSFSQVDALPATRPFRFSPGSSLAITTEAAQDVHDWMIRENIDLTVTSSNRVRVVGAIGDGLGGRDLGDGALTLTSTGGAVRILANISISNNITLSGVTGGINLNGTDTLTGAIITLTGDARGNSDLTITATGVLTINNNINIGTGALSLTGASFTFGSSVDLTAGDHIFDPSRPCDGSTTPTCTDTTP